MLSEPSPVLMVSCYSQQVACPQIFTTTWFFLRETDKQLFRSILCGEGVRNGCLLERAKGEDVKCRFCGRQDGYGHLFWERTFPPSFMCVSSPIFMSLMARNRSNWPRGLLWHGWLPGLGAVDRW